MKKLLIALLTLGSTALVEARTVRHFNTRSGFSYDVQERNELDGRVHVRDLFDRLGY